MTMTRTNPCKAGLDPLALAAQPQVAEARLALAVGVEVARAEEDRARQADVHGRLAALNGLGV